MNLTAVIRLGLVITPLDSLMREPEGFWTHSGENWKDLLQQFAIGNNNRLTIICFPLLIHERGDALYSKFLTCFNKAGEAQPMKVFHNRFTLNTLLVCLIFSVTAFAHDVAEGDKGYIQEISGVHVIPFVYLGAKHMFTGYDHILFLLAVIFFLYRLKEILLYVSLFAVGHSATMLAGVYFGTHISGYLIDAIIGLSVAYKALDNLGMFKRWFGFQPDTKIATLIFGLFHGLGLATKIQDYEVSQDGLLPNLLSFNLGVEIGQLLALTAVLITISYWRRTKSFYRYASLANVAIFLAGVALIGYQLKGYFAQ